MLCPGVADLKELLSCRGSEVAAAAAGGEQKEGGEEWSGSLDEARLDLSSLQSEEPQQHHPSLCRGDGNLTFILSWFGKGILKKS